jgi:hypothetical protein
MARSVFILGRLFLVMYRVLFLLKECEIGGHLRHQMPAYHA